MQFYLTCIKLQNTLGTVYSFLSKYTPCVFKVKNQEILVYSTMHNAMAVYAKLIISNCTANGYCVIITECIILKYR